MSDLSLKESLRYDRMALAFLGGAFLLLLIVSSFHKIGTYGVETDFYWAYAPDAQRILHGQSPQEPGVGPGYAMLLVLFNFIFSDWFMSGKIISVISTILCGFFTYGIFRALFNQRLAFFTLLLWFATALPYAIVASTDMFFAMLVSASIYFLFRHERLTIFNLTFSAVFMGLAFLTRHNAVVLPIGAIFLLLFLNPESRVWQTRLKNAGIFAVIFLMVYMPWMIFQSVTAGNAVRSDSYLIIASHFYGTPGIVSSEDMLIASTKFDSLFSVIFYDFTYFVKHYIGNFYRHFSKLLLKFLQFPTFLFVGAGLFLMAPKLNRRQIGLYVFPVMSFLLLCLVHYESRYYLYILSFFIFPAIYFLFNNSDRYKLNGVFKHINLSVTMFLVTVLFVSVFSAKEIKAMLESEPRELFEISKFMRQNSRANESIIARKPHVGFMSDLETKYFPVVDSLASLLEYAKKEKADYLIYGEMELELRPKLRVLMEPERVSDFLEPVYIWDEPKTIIYKFQI